MTHWGSSPSYLVLLVMMIAMVMEILLAMRTMMRMAALDAASPIIFCPRPVFGTLSSASSVGVSELDHRDCDDDPG